MDVETFRDFCLALPEVTEKFPFAKIKVRGSENILVFYVKEKMFTLIDIENFEFCLLKANPEDVIRLQEEYEAVQPAHHMNKKHWMSVYFHGDVSDEYLKELICNSYVLVAQGKPKRK